MISRLRGEVVRVEDGAAELRAGDLVYEVLIPAADEERLRGSVGETIELHVLHYLESQGQGSSFWPRLIGFRSPLERDFFELFTTVKGIGNRRALRALQMPFGMVAELIIRRDVSMLTTLPEIGRKTAESIVVELKGKVDRFTALGRDAGARAGASAPVPAPPATPGAAAPTKSQRSQAVRASETRAARPSNGRASDRAEDGGSLGAASPMLDAIEVLVQLGESRLTARQLVERALDREPELQAPNDIVTAALRAR